MILDTHSFGALRVLIDQETGLVLAVQDKITGAAASFQFSEAYIQAAVASALRAHESQFSEA